MNQEATNLLTISQAAKMLNLPKSRLYYMVFNKQIPHFKIGSSLRFDVAELTAWLAQKKVGSGEKNG